MQIIWGWSVSPAPSWCVVLVLVCGWGQNPGPKSSGATLVSAVFLVLYRFHCLFLVVVKTLIRELPLTVKGSFLSLAAEFPTKDLFLKVDDDAIGVPLHPGGQRPTHQ